MKKYDNFISTIYLNNLYYDVEWRVEDMQIINCTFSGTDHNAIPEIYAMNEMGDLKQKLRIRTEQIIKSIKNE